MSLSGVIGLMGDTQNETHAVELAVLSRNISVVIRSIVRRLFTLLTAYLFLRGMRRRERTEGDDSLVGLAVTLEFSSQSESEYTKICASFSPVSTPSRSSSNIS